VNVRIRYPDDVAKVLGKSLLWFIFSPDSSNYLPTVLQDHIETAYNGIGQLPPGENPVKKIPLVVSGNEGELYLDELGEDYDWGPGERVGGGHQRETNEQEQLLAVHLQIDQLSRRVGDMRTMQEQHRLQG
jgi:hypothetical protein